MHWTYHRDNRAVTINTVLFVHIPASIWDSSEICSLHQEVTVVPPHDSSLVSILFLCKLCVSTSVIFLITRRRIQLLFLKWTLTNNFLLGSARGEGKQRLICLRACRTMQHSLVGVCINHVEGVYELCFRVRDGNSLATWQWWVTGQIRALGLKRLPHMLCNCPGLWLLLSASGWVDGL